MTTNEALQITFETDEHEKYKINPITWRMTKSRFVNGKLSEKGKISFLKKCGWRENIDWQRKNFSHENKRNSKPDSVLRQKGG